MERREGIEVIPATGSGIPGNFPHWPLGTGRAPCRSSSSIRGRISLMNLGSQSMEVTFDE